jgi:glycosyltransferase involved in cell wall biosynthesis
MGSLAPRLQAAGYEVFHLPFRSNQRYLPDLGFPAAFYRLCRRRRYGVIHIHTEAAPPLYALLARCAGVPRIALTVHNTFRFQGSLRVRKTLERSLVRLLGGRYGMVSEGVAQCERELFHNTGVTLVNWIDGKHFRPPTPQERLAAREQLGLRAAAEVIVSVGNCNKAKNHAVAVHAMEILKSRPELLYLHVGREQSGSPERQLAEQLGVADKIRFCNSQEDVRTFLWACDIFLMPSLHEGLAISALEAIACGCSVIFSRVPGLADLARLAPHIRFIDTDIQQVAAAIVNLLTERDRYRTESTLEDSAAIRAHFSPDIGVSILREELYAIG